MPPPDVLAALRRIPFFAPLSDELFAAIPEGTEVRLPAGALIATEGDPADGLYAVLEGETEWTKKVDGEEVHAVTLGAGTIFAELILLLDAPYPTTGRAVTDVRLYKWEPDAFWRLMAVCPAILRGVLAVATERSQIHESVSQQAAKLASLGRMAAGLAHELNNPAAAARRAAYSLREESLKAQREALTHDGRFTPAQKQQLASLGDETTDVSAYPVFLDTLERSDREDELADWLEDHGVEDAFELAPTLVSAGLDAGRLDALAEGPEGLHDEALVGALEWLGATLNLATLAGEVGASTGRISELVRAMKEYSHMDKTAMREVDVREGLESTLTILAHKLKKGVAVEKEYAEGLPRICANGGELNQVWTNIVDNAVDAMHGQGKLKVKTSRDEENVFVEISDDGPGIPREAKKRIFEPFFTTKGVGEGTGLGLDIVQRIVSGHGGEVRVDSSPGETVFKVRLPINGPRREQNNNGNDIPNGE